MELITFEAVACVSGFHRAMAYKPSLPITNGKFGKIPNDIVKSIDLVICSHGTHDSMVFPAEMLTKNERGAFIHERGKIDMFHIAGSFSQYALDSELLTELAEHNGYQFGGIVNKD